MGRFISGLARRPGLAALALGAVAVLATFGLLRRPPATHFNEGPTWRAARVVEEQFGINFVVGLLVVFGPALEPEHEAPLRALEAAVEAEPWCANLVCPWDLPGLQRATLAECAASPLVRATLVGSDGRGLLLPVLYQPGSDAAFTHPSGDGARFAELVELAQRALDSARVAELERASTSGTQALGQESRQTAQLEVGFTGAWPLMEAQASAFQRERLRFQLFGAALGFLIACLAFRDVRATLLAGLPPVFGVALAIGTTRALGFGAAGFTSIVLPLLVLTIGFTDSLHIVVAAARERRRNYVSGAEAAARALSELAWPCALTSLTTAIGFASLALTGSRAIGEFGLSCAVATLVTFVTVTLSIPLLARTPLGSALERVRPPSFDTHESTSLDRASPDDDGRGLPRRSRRVGPIVPFIDSVVRATLRMPRAVAAVALLVTLALGYVTSNLAIDRYASADLAQSSDAARTLARVDRELGGMFQIGVRLDWDAATGPQSGEASGPSGPEILAVSRQVRALLAGTPHVTPTLGPDLVADSIITASFTPRGAARRDVAAIDDPDRRPLDSLVWLALRAAPRAWLSSTIDLGARRALVHARHPDRGSATLVPQFERLRRELGALERPGLRLTLVGTQLAYLETVSDVARDLAQSLVWAAVLILGTLALAFRSWRIGLAACVPNLLPIAASAAGLAVIGRGVDISTLTALTLSLGIATDDTIHVLARWRSGREAGLMPEVAAHRAVMHTLPALALTTLTLGAAFLQLLTSDLPTIRDFGLLAATTLGVAFLADVWLLPAFLVLTARRSGRG